MKKSKTKKKSKKSVKKMEPDKDKRTHKKLTKADFDDLADWSDPMARL